MRHSPSFRRSAGLLLLPTLLGACIQWESVEFRIDGFNERLRADRAALDAAQSSVAPDSLRYGPWPTRSDALVRPLTPAHPQAGVLVQSDCWFMGRAPLGGGDAVRADWEAVALFADQGTYEDPEDGRLDVGLCRFADPETRVPPLHRDRRSETFAEIDCGAELGSVAVPSGVNLFRCRADTAIFGFRLTALRDTAPDPLGRCVLASSARYGQALDIARGVDFWSGPHLDGAAGPEVGSCGSGNTLVPGAATAYEISSLPDAPRQRFEPALLPVASGTRVARALASGRAGLEWSTAVSRNAATGAQRWQENWSPSLRVATVRLVGFDPPLRPEEQRPDARPLPLDASSPPRLCIEDPAFGPGCRWTCEDMVAADGALAWPILSPGSCRNSNGVPEIPLLTPTYALDRLAAGVAPAPLRWIVQGGGWTLPWLEFELQTTFEPAALRAEPATADAGPLQVGRSGRVGYRVDNVGGQPLVVTAVELLPGFGQAGEFRVELPHAPVPLPLPLEIDPAGAAPVVLPPPDLEAFPALALFQGPAHLRLRATAQGTLEHEGLVLTRRTGQWQRDVLDVGFKPKPQQDGHRMPFATLTWALRRPPFVVQPGEAFDLSVLARPAAAGVREARVRVRGHSQIDPTRSVEIVVLARARGLSGPRLQLLPQQLSVHAAGPGEERTRSILLSNDGDTTGQPGTPVLAATTPASLSAFALELTEGGAGPLAPGASRLVRVRWRAHCPPGASGLAEDSAELRWPTPDGTLAVPLRGATWCGP
jgi:hypothetical protein